MKIAYSFPFRLGAPGIGAAALSQIEALAARGCEIQVYCRSSTKRIPGVKIFQTKPISPIPQRFMGRQMACRLHDYLTAALLRNRSDDFDVVHTWPLAAELTLKVARERGWLGVREAPNTHTAHAMDVVANEHRVFGIEQEKNHSHTFNKSVLDREIREYDGADLILAPSELAIETFVRRGVPRSKLALKSYGFDPRQYVSSAGVHTNNGLTFTFIARCEPRKGLHLALEAWLKSGVADRTYFQVTGHFIPGYRERLQPMLEHKNVTVNDFVDDLRPIYQAADVLVLPSVEEGSALVTYEAQASGCALLVSDAAGARFTDGKEGLLHKARDVETLSRQMRQLADDPALVLRMQLAGVENAPQYTWDRATEKLVDAYEAALGRTKS